MIETGNCYKIAGRRPIVVVRLQYGTGKRYTVEGYTPRRYAQHLKFNVYDPEAQKTLAEIENIAPPIRTRFRFNSKSSIEKIELKDIVPSWDTFHPTYTVDEIDQILAKKR